MTVTETARQPTVAPWLAIGAPGQSFSFGTYQPQQGCQLSPVLPTFKIYSLSFGGKSSQKNTSNIQGVTSIMAFVSARSPFPYGDVLRNTGGYGLRGVQYSP